MDTPERSQQQATAGTSAPVAHTPGPWHQSHREMNDGNWRTTVHTTDGQTVCTLSWYPRPPVDTNVGRVIGTYREANALLIAAAPDLLAALKDMRDALAAMMRVVAMHKGAIAEEFGQEIDRLGIRRGFGVRAQNAIARAEGH